MTRLSPRTRLHSSELLRCLADLAIADALDPGDAFTEKLGLWIHFADAISLSAVHNDSVASSLPAGLGASAAAHAAARAEFDRVRGGLANSIVNSCASGSGKTHIKLPATALELPADPALAYVPYRRFYEAHQRDMELGIQPLRTNLRAALAKVSPKLRKLAELDATLEKILRDRENKLLSKVPALLKKRFEYLLVEHRHKLADVPQADDPARWAQPGGWLARFCRDMQMLLLAELELRLQPAMGLIEAYQQDTQ